mgnify:CR=1 FL=1
MASTAVQSPAAGDASAGRPTGAGALVERDRDTGRSYLKVPLPDADALAPLLKLLQQYAAGNDRR